jgi:hypothetical protein
MKEHRKKSKQSWREGKKNKENRQHPNSNDQCRKHKRIKGTQTRLDLRSISYQITVRNYRSPV